MTMLRPQRRARVGIDPSIFSQPYWDGCAIGELRFQHCPRCATAVHTPAAVCPSCHRPDPDWRVSSGRGVLHSVTVVHRAVTPEFDVPYAPVLVAMDEGWVLLSALIDCDHTEAAIGLHVETVFHVGADGFSLPYVRPVAPAVP